MSLKLYQHYKGGLYIVMSPHGKSATNGDDVIDLVVTYQCVKSGVVYTRVHSEFFERMPDGTRRFREIRSAADIEAPKNG